MNYVKLYGVKPPLYARKRVALVGNSDILLKKDYSKEIDSMGTVIRFNYGNIMDRYTGKKTSIRWMNGPLTHTCARHYNKSVKNQKDLEKYVKRIFAPGIKIMAWPWLANKVGTVAGNKSKFTPNNLHEFRNVNKMLRDLKIQTRFDATKKNCWPRTGFHAILTCIKSGIVPYLYGFDMHEKERIGHYSKVDTTVTDNIPCHQVRTELKILREMIKKKLVVLRR